jgi:hypothetical protein
MSIQLALPARRNHITQKVRIPGQRTLYISVVKLPERSFPHSELKNWRDQLGNDLRKGIDDALT